jgi:MFS family permease
MASTPPRRPSTDEKAEISSPPGSSISEYVFVVDRGDPEAQGAGAESESDRGASGDNQNSTGPGPVPDGGLQAWLQVLGSWVVLVDTWGVINSFGLWLTYYEKQLLVGVSASDLSWIGSLQAALLMFVGPIAGPLFDAGYFRELLWVGLFLIVFGMFTTSLCTTYWQLMLAQGVCVGIGCGLTFLPSTAILSQYFHKRRALAIGLASTGSPIAGVVLPIVFGKLVPSVGFPWATRAVAFILLAVSIIPLATMRVRTPPSGQKRSLVDKKALRDVPFLLCCLGIAIAFLTLYVAYFYIQLFAIEFDITSFSFSNYLVTIMSAGSIIGRVLPNYAADKFGSLNIITLVTFVSGILCLAWLSIRNLDGLAAFAFLYGLFSGGIVSITPSVIVCLTPDLSLVGTRMGMTFFVTAIAVLCGTPIGGAILKRNGEKAWLAAIGYSAAALLLGSLALLASRVALYRKHREWRA